MNVQQPTIHYGIIVLKNGAHVQKEVSRLFFRHTWWWVDIFIIKDDFWTLMDIVIIDLTCIEWCNKHQWWQHMQQWWLLRRKHDHMLNKHHAMTSFPCYWDIWVSSFSFWFIFYRLCINHYCMSLMVFFSPFDVGFLLLTTHLHNLTMCISHSDFLTGCYVWLGFLISSTHQS